MIVCEKTWDVIEATGLPPEVATLYGFVHDKDGNPLPAVSVTLDSYETATMLDGTFDFINIAADSYTITCTKAGYKEFSKDITLSEGDNEIDITMEVEVPPPPPTEVPWLWIGIGLGAVAVIGGGIALAKKRKEVA